MKRRIETAATNGNLDSTESIALSSDRMNILNFSIGNQTSNSTDSILLQCLLSLFSGSFPCLDRNCIHKSAASFASFNRKTRVKVIESKPSKVWKGFLFGLIILGHTAMSQENNETTKNPTVAPSVMPTPNVTTIMPTASPTVRYFVSEGRFRQNFLMESEINVFNDSDVELLMGIFENYTELLIQEVGFSNVTKACSDADENPICTYTSCLLDEQTQVIESNETANSVDYSCTYKSQNVNTSGIRDYFPTFVNANLDNLTEQMKELEMPVDQALQVAVRLVSTNAPTATFRPSASPTIRPTITRLPTPSPSSFPSNSPSLFIVPTPPNEFTLAPTAESDEPNFKIIASTVVVGGAVAFALLLWYYINWKRKNSAANTGSFPGTENSTSPTMGEQSRRISLRNRHGRSSSRSNERESAGRFQEPGNNVVISPTDSLLSNKSLVSAGELGLGEESGDEYDGTKNLQDEFDKYRDQNLEQLRQDVEGNLTGFEGIMSAAVTSALMGDEERNVDMQELLWGCGPNPTGTEIEASALYEVCDWLKRNEGVPSDRKRAFMQEILNKMVTSVRYGVLKAEDASRTIHESAALLELPLAEELPMTTVLVSGMRKTATAEDMVKAMREFGDIDVAAMASGRRGFGVVRFRRLKSVERALRRYQSGEIVIQDVAVQVKVLKPNDDVDVRG
jgi:hypothetical protein